MSERLNFEEAYNQAHCMQFMMYDDVLGQYQGSGQRYLEYDYHQEDCNPQLISFGAIHKPYSEEMLETQSPKKFRNYEHYSKEYDASADRLSKITEPSEIEQLDANTLRYIPLIYKVLSKSSKEQIDKTLSDMPVEDTLSYDLAMTVSEPEAAVELLGKHVVNRRPTDWGEPTRWSQTALERAVNNPTISLHPEDIDQLCLMSNYDENRAKSDSFQSKHFTENYYYNTGSLERLDELYDQDSYHEDRRVVLKDPNVSAQKVAEIERRDARIEENALKHFVYAEERLNIGLQHKLARLERTVLKNFKPQGNVQSIDEQRYQDRLTRIVRPRLSDYQIATPFRRGYASGGDGELLYASCKEGFGAISIAPPSISAFIGEPPSLRSQWRICEYGMNNGESGEAYIGNFKPLVRPMVFADIYKAPEMEEHRDFLGAMFIAHARHIATSEKNFYVPEEDKESFHQEVKQRLENLHSEWKEATGKEEMIDRFNGKNIMDLFEENT